MILGGDWLWKGFNDFLVHSVYFVTYKEDMIQLTVWNYIKTYQADNLFWAIFDMEENIKQRDSLRANGAYTVPSLKISERSLDIKELKDVEEASYTMVKFVSNEHDDFMKSVCGNSKIFNQYLLKQTGYLREELIKMIANIELQNIEVAKQMVQEEIQKGNRSGFRNNNKDIYEYILEYCKCLE